MIGNDLSTRESIFWQTYFELTACISFDFRGKEQAKYSYMCDPYVKIFIDNVLKFTTNEDAVDQTTMNEIERFEAGGIKKTANIRSELWIKR